MAISLTKVAFICAVIIHFVAADEALVGFVQNGDVGTGKTEIQIPDKLSEVFWEKWQVWYDHKTKIDVFLVIELFVTKQQYDILTSGSWLMLLQRKLREEFSRAKFYRANDIRVVAITYNRSSSSTKQIAGSIDAIEKEFPNQTLVGYPENWLTQSEKAEALYPAPAGYSNITAQKVFDVCATFFEKQTFIENEIQIGYVTRPSETDGDIGKIEPKSHNFLSTVWKLWYTEQPKADQFRLFVLYVEDEKINCFKGSESMLVDLRSAVQKAFDESSDILLISWKAEDGEELFVPKEFEAIEKAEARMSGAIIMYPEELLQVRNEKAVQNNEDATIAYNTCAPIIMEAFKKDQEKRAAEEAQKQAEEQAEEDRRRELAENIKRIELERLEKLEEAQQAYENAIRKAEAEDTNKQEEAKVRAEEVRDQQLRESKKVILKAIDEGKRNVIQKLERQVPKKPNTIRIGYVKNDGTADFIQHDPQGDLRDLWATETMGTGEIAHYYLFVVRVTDKQMEDFKMNDSKLSHLQDHLELVHRKSSYDPPVGHRVILMDKNATQSLMQVAEERIRNTFDSAEIIYPAREVIRGIVHSIHFVKVCEDFFKKYDIDRNL